MRIFELNEDVMSIDETIEESIGPIIIDFYASWCGPCSILSKTFDSVINESIKDDDATLIKVNIEENPVTTKKYNVRSIPTCIYILDGENSESKRTTGLISAEDIKKFFVI